MVSFTQAVEWMRKGKKVVCKRFVHQGYIFMTELGYFRGKSGTTYTINKNDFDDMSWEIYEEPETLSDKIYIQALGSERMPDSVSVEDLKKALRKLQEGNNWRGEIDVEKLTKVFGGKLLN